MQYRYDFRERGVYAAALPEVYYCSSTVQCYFSTHPLRLIPNKIIVPSNCNTLLQKTVVEWCTPRASPTHPYPQPPAKQATSPTQAGGGLTRTLGKIPEFTASHYWSWSIQSWGNFHLCLVLWPTRPCMTISMMMIMNGARQRATSSKPHAAMKIASAALLLSETLIHTKIVLFWTTTTSTRRATSSRNRG